MPSMLARFTRELPDHLADAVRWQRGNEFHEMADFLLIVFERRTTDAAMALKQAADRVGLDMRNALFELVSILELAKCLPEKRLEKEVAAALCKLAEHASFSLLHRFFKPCGLRAELVIFLAPLDVILHIEQFLINLPNGLVVPAAIFFRLLIHFPEFSELLLQTGTLFLEPLHRHVRINADFLIELPDDGAPAVPRAKMANGIVDGFHPYKAVDSILECLAVPFLCQFLAHAVNPFAVKKEEARKLLRQDGFHCCKACHIIERLFPLPLIIPLADKEILADMSVLIVELLPAELVNFSFLLDFHLDANRASLPPQIKIANFAIDDFRISKSCLAIETPKKRLLERRLARAILAHDDRNVLLGIRRKVKMLLSLELTEVFKIHDSDFHQQAP